MNALKKPSDAMEPSCNIALRLREAMQRRGISSAELARKAGVRTSFLYDVLRGKSHNPSIIRLSKVAQVLDMPVTSLMAPAEIPAGTEHHGSAIEWLGPSQKQASIFFNEAWLQSQRIGAPAQLRMHVINNDSMEPTLRTNDLILVNISQCAPEHMGIFLIVMGQEVMVRRLERSAGSASTYRLRPDNPAYPLALLDAEDANILGRVVWISRPL
ncbi:MAG: XRE family transcriptional regulator [Alphaproteobacteria bacterium]